MSGRLFQHKQAKPTVRGKHNRPFAAAYFLLDKPWLPVYNWHKPQKPKAEIGTSSKMEPYREQPDGERRRRDVL